MSQDIRPDMSDKEFVAAMREHPEKLQFPGALLMSFGPQDYVGMTVAIRGVLYFDGGHTKARRAAIADCFDSFAKVAGPHLKWLLQDEPKKGPAHVPYARVKPIRDWLGALGENDLLGFEYTSGEKEADASPYTFRVDALRKWQADMGDWGLDCLRFSLPFADVVEQPTLFQSLFIEAMNKLEAYHGRGGFAFILSPTDAEANQPTEALAAPDVLGADVSEPIDPRHMTREVIKSVSWLTALDGELVKKLGGIRGLRSELPPAWFAFYPTQGGGVVIQAGNAPDIAPKAIDPEPPLLVLVNHALKDVRVEHPGFFHVLGSNHGEPRMTGVRVAQWMARLDVPDDQLLAVKERLLKVPKLDAAHTLQGKG